jgi:hypothetical protein
VFLFSFSGGSLLLISRRRRSAAAAEESACRGSERVLVVVVVVQVAFLGLGVEGGASRQAGKQPTLVVERTNALGSLRRHTYVCVVAVRFSPEINTVLVDTRGEFLRLFIYVRVVCCVCCVGLFFGKELGQSLLHFWICKKTPGRAS